jgi:prepilin-type N-terminal cleavage/methylation domain-containing protein
MSRAWKHPRRGFTIVELLVTISILGLLMAILIPAVQRSRETANRLECVNHLKQIGIALAAHQSAQGKFPAARRPDSLDSSGRPTCSGCLSIHYQILPFVDQSPLYNAMNVPSYTATPAGSGLPRPPYDRSNQTFHDTRLSTFLCPSDYAGLTPGNHYRGTVGPFANYFESGSIPGGGGAFPGFDGLAPRDFPDGLSTTIGFSERVLGSGRQSGFDRQRDYWYSGVMAVDFSMSGDRLMAACASLDGSSPATWTKGGTWWSFANYSDTLYNHVAPPNWNAMDCGGFSQLPDGNLAGSAISARSLHPGGVNGLTMDGSVHFFRDAIQLSVWRALSTRSGHESISTDIFSF